ncbi:MAG: 2OG-Fe(II) oxygenase, partial [Solirubrobacteraceae bacterium]
MAGEARQRLAHLLGELDARGWFSVRTTAPPDDLQVDVRGVGRLILPVSDDQARALCKIARPARYGQGEQTLLDRRVRDTLEVPRSRVRIDGRRWRRTLQPVLEALRDDLGLPSTSRLQAQLHSFLVYARGQFFLPHQDSEKDDEMVATLVVTLPSRFTGGSLVVAHEGRRASYRGSKAALSFVAFYADCRHEVKPVTSGHRIVLTYNLLLRRDSDAADLPDAPPEAVHALEALLAEHFSAPAPGWRENPRGNPPSRLVYLLDHEYTERGLGWERLKGHDVGRASTLRWAAVDADCDAVLCLAQVHETWSTTPFDDRWYGRGRRSWHEDDDDDYGELAGEDEYELDELIEQTVELQCWLREPGAARPVRISL